MSAGKPTEGPWQPFTENCAYYQGVPMTRVAKYWPGAGAYEVVADCSHAVTGSASGEANARLISAAPDMLAALEGIIFTIQEDAPDHVWDAAWNNARAAIAKAKGVAA